MEGSLLQMSSMHSMKLMELKDNFHLRELFSKMGLLKGKIELFKK